MPTFVSRRLQDMLNDQFKPVRGSKVLLLGVTYKANISDRRESPAVPLAKRLISMGCILQYNDPSVGDWEVDGVAIERVIALAAGAAAADAIVIVQPHSVYLDDPNAITESGTPVLDTTGKFRGNLVELL